MLAKQVKNKLILTWEKGDDVKVGETITIDVDSNGLKELDDILNIQLHNGNWNYDPYMMGMANGLILARHLILGEQGEPVYKKAPTKWLRYYPSLLTKMKWKLFGMPMSACADLSAELKRGVLYNSTK